MTAIVTAGNGRPYVFRPVEDQAVWLQDAPWPRPADHTAASGLATLRAHLDPYRHDGPALVMVQLPGGTRAVERTADAVCPAANVARRRILPRRTALAQVAGARGEVLR